MESDASNFVTTRTDYSESVEFVFKCYEENPNLTLFSDSLFKKWLLFTLRIPDLKSYTFQTRILKHIGEILKKIRTSQV